jgi:hypothetical protein
MAMLTNDHNITTSACMIRVPNARDISCRQYPLPNGRLPKITSYCRTIWSNKYKTTADPKHYNDETKDMESRKLPVTLLPPDTHSSLRFDFHSLIASHFCHLASLVFFPWLAFLPSHLGSTERRSRRTDCKSSWLTVPRTGTYRNRSFRFRGRKLFEYDASCDIYSGVERRLTGPGSKPGI